MKDAVGTAYSASSRIWFTCSHGILNEIYHPTIDRAQIRDMEFLVTDGETFVHEEKRDLIYDLRVHPPRSPGRSLRQPRSRRALHADQGDHLRSAPQRAPADVRLEGRRGPAAAAEGATRCWRRISTAAAPATRPVRSTLPAQRCCWRGRTSGRWPWAPVADSRASVAALSAPATAGRTCWTDFTHGLGVRLGHQRQHRAHGRTEPRVRAHGDGRRARVHDRHRPWRRPPYRAAEDGERAGHALSSSIATASSSSGTGPPIPSGWRPSRPMAAS